MKEIYLAGGSFWGLQKYLDLIFGVIHTEVGYANGRTKFTKYLTLNETDHTEVVKVLYNPKILSLNTLLNYYYDVINPTSINKQGNDVGRQYRTGIYYVDKEDVPIIIRSLELLGKIYPKKIVVEVEALKNFIRAENYHQNFLRNNPFGYCNIPLESFENVKIRQLDNLVYRVMKLKDTEKAFANEYYDNFDAGIYVDKETNRPLFLSTDKYNSGSGWPSFYKTSFKGEIDVHLVIDNLQLRNEVRSKVGKSHLGYLFYDGPYGRRYLINSAALRFIPKREMINEGYGAYIRYIDKNI